MDYKVYQITKKEMFRYAAVYILADVLISLLFYRSVLAAVVFLPGICFFFREVRRELAKKRRKQLGISGRDAVCFYRPDGGIFG